MDIICLQGKYVYTEIIMMGKCHRCSRPWYNTSQYCDGEGARYHVRHPWEQGEDIKHYSGDRGTITHLSGMILPGVPYNLHWTCQINTYSLRGKTLIVV